MEHVIPNLVGGDMQAYQIEFVLVASNRKGSTNKLYL